MFLFKIIHSIERIFEKSEFFNNQLYIVFSLFCFFGRWENGFGGTGVELFVLLKGGKILAIQEKEFPHAISIGQYY